MVRMDGVEQPLAAIQRGESATDPAASLVKEARERDDLRVHSDPEPVAFDDGQYKRDVIDA
ncbi:hypothetical protein [Halarchaeum salinum]|uniref:Uncharacterized protein n=1 Tax=Halarchaeum salinum TaxID=489912 RepID=A0AAV3SCK8_9EURY